MDYIPISMLTLSLSPSKGFMANRAVEGMRSCQVVFSVEFFCIVAQACKQKDIFLEIYFSFYPPVGKNLAGSVNVFARRLRHPTLPPAEKVKQWLAQLLQKPVYSRTCECQCNV